MAKDRRKKTSDIFRAIAIPALMICAVVDKQLFRYLSAAVSAIWLANLTIRLGKSVVEKKKAKKKGTLLAIEPKKEKVVDDSSLFLFRQVNCRITEQLKATYPDVSWLWVNRPDANEMAKGGTWRIRLANAEPFNFAEVEMTDMAQININLMQILSLKDATELSNEDEDIRQEEMLEKPDAEQWYSEFGQATLGQIIDDLNSQGHKRMLVQEDGSICVRQNGTSHMIQRIQDFPPRLSWDKFSAILEKDDIKTNITADGLQMSW